MTSFYGPAMELSTTASRMDMSLAWINALAERRSMGMLRDLGFGAVHDHDARLATMLRAALRDAGVPFLDHGEGHGSAIVSCAPAGDRVAERLAEAGVVATARAGRVRISIHVHNTADEVALRGGAPAAPAEAVAGAAGGRYWSLARTPARSLP